MISNGMNSPLRAGWRAACAAVLIASMLLAACGGGGGGGAGGGGGGGGETAATLTADYFPLATGDRRSWRTTAGSDAGAVTHERVLDATQLDGRTVRPVVDNTGATTYYAVDGSAVLQVPTAADGALLMAIGPLTVMRLGQSAGQTDVTLDRTVTVDIDGSGQAVPVDLHVESTFVGVESVSTAAGVFSDTAHVRSVLRTTVHPVGAGPVVITVTSDDWYARAVGPVKNISSSTTPTGTTSSMDEVFAWGVGGRHSDAVAPTLVGASPADGAALAPLGPLALNFSEAIDPLSVDGANGLALLDAAGTAMNLTRSGSSDGKQWTLTPAAALPDGRYTWRVGTAVSDLAGNAMAVATGSVVVDSHGPRLTASQPADGATEAPLTGQVWLRFDEAVFSMPGSALRLQVLDVADNTAQELDATISGGNMVVATLATPLQRNRAYMLVLAGDLVDAYGNGAPRPVVANFRTDPGPLSRPQSIDPDAADVKLVKVADLDGDGRPDLVMIVQYPGSSELHLAVRRGQAAGGLAPAAELMRFDNLAGWPYCQYSSPALEVLDADGDGRPDVLLPCGSGSLVLRQTASGSFVPETVASVGPYGAFAVDTDGSGRGRLVTISLGGGSSQANLLARTADGSWVLAGSNDLGGQTPLALRYLDLDGDGRRDQVWLRADNSGTLIELASRLAASDGSLGPIQSFSLGIGDVPGFDFADLDGDGVPELVLNERYKDPLTGISGTRVRVWKRTAGGAYASAQTQEVSPNASSLLVADLDGDGRADVIVAHDSVYQVGVLLQGTDGLLQSERVFEASYGARQPLAVIDVDGDGRRDLVDGTVVLLARPYPGSWPLGARRSGAQALRAALPGR